MSTTQTPLVHFVLHTEIHIPPNRDRKAFDDAEIKALADSISNVGLLHLPVVRASSIDYILVVGERRLRAMRRLHDAGTTFYCMGFPVPKNTIPVLFYEELSEAKAKEVELEENLRRVDLSWQERVQAIATLHNHLGGTASNTVATMTSNYNTTINITRVSTSVLLSQHLNHPEVATARTEVDAVKQMYKVIQRQIDLKLGQTAQPTCDFRLGEAISEMLNIPNGRIDVICMDPPYGIDADKSDMHQFQTANVHHYKDKWEDVRDLLSNVANIGYNICKPQAHLYMFCDIIHFDELKKIFTTAGWNVWSRPIIWMKDTGVVPALDYGPRRMYESILFANKGQKMVTGVFNDCVNFPYDGVRVHAAQKPTALVRNLLVRSCRAGDVVLDPFCGSGTIFIAGNDLKLTTIGIDNDPAMSAIIAKRIKDGK